MKPIFALLIFIFALTACGGGESASDKDLDESSYADDDWENDSDDEDADEEDFADDPELGMLRVDHAGENRETLAFCSLTITRMDGDDIATIYVGLSVLGFDEKPSANADFGDISANWGTDPDNGVVTMGFSYEPPLPDDSDADDLGWVYDPMNPKPPSLALTVDGEPYDFARSDARGADDLRTGPHLWQTSLVMSANLVNPRDNGEMNRAQGNFTYDGLCSVTIQVLVDRG